MLKYQLAYSFVLLGVFMSEKNMSSSREFCVNDLNNFCYICGKYCQQLQRRNITDFVKQSYEAYFFQIYNRLNHQCCTVKICQCRYLLPYQTFPMMMLKC
jgi:hypothetical protein